MKKFLSALIINLIAGMYVNAQPAAPFKSLQTSIGVDIAVPVGTESSYISTVVLGGSLLSELKVAPNFGLTLSAGYESWFIKDNASLRSVFGKSLNYISVLGGIKYYFIPKVYGAAQLGIVFSTKQGYGSSFAYSPGLGFQVSKKIDILAKYSGKYSASIGSFNNVGVRLAYSL